MYIENNREAEIFTIYTYYVVLWHEYYILHCY